MRRLELAQSPGSALQFVYGALTKSAANIEDMIGAWSALAALVAIDQHETAIKLAVRRLYHGVVDGGRWAKRDAVFCITLIGIYPSESVISASGASITLGDLDRSVLGEPGQSGLKTPPRPLKEIALAEDLSDISLSGFNVTRGDAERFVCWSQGHIERVAIPEIVKEDSADPVIDAPTEEGQAKDDSKNETMSDPANVGAGCPKPKKRGHPIGSELARDIAGLLDQRSLTNPFTVRELETALGSCGKELRPGAGSTSRVLKFMIEGKQEGYSGDSERLTRKKDGKTYLYTWTPRTLSG